MRRYCGEYRVMASYRYARGTGEATEGIALTQMTSIYSL